MKMTLDDNPIDRTSPNRETDTETVPDTLPIMPIRGMVAFPRMKVPFMVSMTTATLIDDAMKKDRVVGLLTAKSPGIENPVPGELYEAGTVAKILHTHRNDEGVLVVLLKGLNRFRVSTWQTEGAYLRAKILLAPEIVESDLEMEALARELREAVKNVMDLMPHIPEEAAGMPAEALKEARRELERIQQMSPQSAEYPMIKTYLEWLLDLSWTHTSKDNGDEDLPAEMRNAMTFIPADRINEVIATALDSERPPGQLDSEATMKNQAGRAAGGSRPAPVTCQG
jgi:ATP-dependent Lon protease